MGERINIDDRLDYWAFYTQYVTVRQGVKPNQDGNVKAFCPYHHESNESFSFNVKTGKWHCFSGCGSGNAISFLARMENTSKSDAWKKLCNIAGVPLEQAQKPKTKLPLTLEEYASSKKIPVEFLSGLGCETTKDNRGFAWVSIPVYSEDGNVSCVKRRYHPDNTIRFAYDEGGKLIPYGVWLKINKQADSIVLVEGESDAQTLWLHHVPALGIPGSTTFQAAWVDYLRGKTVILHRENDGGGNGFISKCCAMLDAAGFAGEVYEISVSDAFPSEVPTLKDPSALHVKHGDAWDSSAWGAVMATKKKIDVHAVASQTVEAVEATQAQQTQQTSGVKPFAIYDASELPTMDIQPARCIVQGLIGEGLFFLAGRQKLGKSWLALQLALCVASGTSFLGRGVSRGDVLYLDLEGNPRRLRERIAAIWPSSIPKMGIVHGTEYTLADGGLLAQINGWVWSRLHHPCSLLSGILCLAGDYLDFPSRCSSVHRE